LVIEYFKVEEQMENLPVMKERGYICRVDAVRSLVHLLGCGMLGNEASNPFNEICAPFGKLPPNLVVAMHISAREQTVQKQAHMNRHQRSKRFFQMDSKIEIQLAMMWPLPWKKNANLADLGSGKSQAKPTLTA
jgi:hypothetical protein